MAGHADATVVTHDPDNQWLLINFGDHTVQLEPVVQVRFQRGDQDSPEAYALWLDASRAQVLERMIDYILTRIKISEASQATLRQLLPEVRQIAASLGSPDDGDE
jgi:hypothetical protein